MKGRVTGLTDSENAELKLDAIMKKIWEAIMKEESGVQVTDPKRMSQFMACDEVMKQTIRGKNVRIESIPHSNYASVGVIRITAKEFTVTDPKLFAMASALASNFEMYPKLDGTMVMALTFYGMTRKADG